MHTYFSRWPNVKTLSNMRLHLLAPRSFKFLAPGSFGTFQKKSTASCVHRPRCSSGFIFILNVSWSINCQYFRGPFCISNRGKGILARLGLLDQDRSDMVRHFDRVTVRPWELPATTNRDTAAVWFDLGYELLHGRASVALTGQEAGWRLSRAGSVATLSIIRPIKIRKMDKGEINA